MKELFLLLLLLFGSLSCSDKKKDTFYNSSCGLNCKKIPLINPCYIGSTTGIDGSWYLTDCYKKSYGTAQVSYVNVIDSLILYYYFNQNIIVPENRDTLWYIIIPSTQKEFVFVSELEFNNQVKNFTDRNIILYKVSELYRQLNKIGYLEWYPENMKFKNS